MDVIVSELEGNNKTELISLLTPEGRNALLIKEQMTASLGETLGFMNSGTLLI